MAGHSSKTLIMINQTKQMIQSVLGWALALFFGAATIYAVTDIHGGIDVAVAIMFLLITIIGVSLILKSKKHKKLIKLFRLYTSHLAINPEKSIDFLAMSTNESTQNVIKNIEEMIKYGYFKEVYIDIGKKCLVFANISRKENAAAPNNKNIHMNGHIIVICNGCGAKNKIIKGSVGECQYCGMPISENKG